jgi:hypothetical protein
MEMPSRLCAPSRDMPSTCRPALLPDMPSGEKFAVIVVRIGFLL